MSPLGWFLAGGVAALVFERTAYRWLRRRWLLLVGLAFAGVSAVAFGDPARARELGRLAVEVLGGRSAPF